jgi:ribosome-interacting GTPase 1
VRYADDMIFILKPQDDAEQIQQQIDHFLSERGMSISQEKTKVTAVIKKPDLTFSAGISKFFAMVNF